MHGLLAILRRLDAGKCPGYSRHPETLRWLDPRYRVALWRRHEALAEEMTARGFTHASPVPDPTEVEKWVTTWPQPLDDQVSALAAKGCECRAET